MTERRSGSERPARSRGRVGLASLAPAFAAALGTGSFMGSTDVSPTTASTVVSAPVVATGTADELDQLVVEFVGDAEGGVAVLLTRDGVTTSTVVGAANAAGDPTTADTPFRVANISKPFVATIVMQLVDEGRIDLDEPLSTYLPETLIGANVPIRMLPNHRSGLRDYTERSAFIPDVYEDRTRIFTPDEILAWVEDAVTDEPDQHFAYSNTNYILLGQLIERVDGTDIDTALQLRISEPLGLDATRFATVEAANPDGLAAPWSTAVFHGDPDAAYDSVASSAWAAGSLTSTTGELATFLAGLFAGKLISENSLDEMTTTGREGYGLGLELYQFPSGARFYGHVGEIDGYTSVMAFDPGTGDTLVVLTNNDMIYAPELAGAIIDNWWAGQPVTPATNS